MYDFYEPLVEYAIAVQSKLPLKLHAYDFTKRRTTQNLKEFRSASANVGIDIISSTEHELRRGE
jgi:hypothetical protein